MKLDFVDKMFSGVKMWLQVGKASTFGIGLTFGIVGKTIFDRIMKGEHGDEVMIEGEIIDTGSLSSEMKDFTLKYGLPKPYPVLSYTNHIIGYDMMHKTPSWVVQNINRNTLDGNANRQNCNFRRDQNIPEIYSASNKDYVHTTYSKGHLAAAGDNRSSQQAMDETFLFTNIVPQNPQNNKGIWLKIERFCRKLAKKYSNIYVISGPLYMATEKDDKHNKIVKYHVIGEREVAVPTHLYKVILIEKNGNPYATCAFIIPNSQIPNGKCLSDFIFKLKHLEEKLGHQLFPKFNCDILPCLCSIENCKLVS